MYDAGDERLLAASRAAFVDQVQGLVVDTQKLSRGPPQHEFRRVHWTLKDAVLSHQVLEKLAANFAVSS
jgi:hypothetical protein